MKKLTITLCFCFITTTILFSQSLVGKKGLTIGLNELILYSNSFKGESLTATNTNSAFTFSINPVVTLGKVNSKNELWSYGLGLGYSYTKTKNDVNGKITSYNSYKLSPTLTYQKLYKIVDKVYYSFNLSLSASYSHSKLSEDPTKYNTYGSDFYIYPMAVSYMHKNKYNLILKTGTGLLHYLYTYRSNINDDPNRKDKSEELNFSFYPSSFNFSIQIFY